MILPIHIYKIKITRGHTVEYQHNTLYISDIIVIMTISFDIRNRLEIDIKVKYWITVSERSNKKPLVFDSLAIRLLFSYHLVQEPNDKSLHAALGFGYSAFITELSSVTVFSPALKHRQLPGTSYRLADFIVVRCMLDPPTLLRQHYYCLQLIAAKTIIHLKCVRCSFLDLIY